MQYNYKTWNRGVIPVMMMGCNGWDANSTNCPNTMQRNEKKCWSCNDPRCQKIIISQEGDDLRLAINDPPGGRRYRFEICSARFNEMTEDFRPIVSRIPRDFTGWVDFHGHNLRNATALYEYNKGSNSPTAATAFFSSADISGHKGIMAGYICPRYYMGICYWETV